MKIIKRTRTKLVASGWSQDGRRIEIRCCGGQFFLDSQGERRTRITKREAIRIFFKMVMEGDSEIVDAEILYNAA